MSKFWDKILGREPAPESLPDPFDEDLEDAYLDGPSALAAEKPSRYYNHPYNSEEWKVAYEKHKKRNENAILPPPREPRVTKEDDDDQAQHWTWEAAKRGIPMKEWMEGRDFKQLGGWVTATQYWENPTPLAEHYSPAISKYRKSKSDEWRGLTKDSWFNYSTPTDQPLGGHLQVIVDKSTKFTHHYCQAGHLHTYRNGELVTQWTKAALPGDTYPKRYLVSKHFPPHEFVVDYSSSMSARDKTIVESPLCDN